MGWLRKARAALVALWSRQEIPSNLRESAPVVRSSNLRSVPVEDNPNLDTPSAENLARLDHGTDLHHLPGSPLKALIDQMEKAFPVPSIKPDSDMASLQYAAGQRAVVDWVRMKQKRGQA